jgi:hypothetical protein
MTPFARFTWIALAAYAVLMVVAWVVETYLIVPGP